MKNTALKTLEHSINYYLKLDSNKNNQTHYLDKLDNKIIAFHLKHPAISIIFNFENGYIKITDYPSVNQEKSENSEIETVIHAHIYTSLFQIMRLKFRKNKSLVNSGFHIKGDIEIVKNLNHLFEEHQIDWEEHLSKFTGDVLAHKAGNIFKKNKSYIKKTRDSLIDNMGEYLQEEKQILPHPLAIDNFNKNIDELRLQLDRTQARLMILNKKIEGKGEKN